MATASELETMLQDFGRLAYNLQNSQSIPTDESTLAGNNKGRDRDRRLAAVATIRDDVASALRRGRLRGWFVPWTRDWLRDVMTRSPLPFARAFREIRANWAANGRAVVSREINFETGGGTGSVTGTGRIVRLVVDENGDPIESEQASTKTLEVVADQTIGSAEPHEELFELRDEEAPEDNLESALASGDSMRRTALSAASAGSLLSNPGFQQINGLDGGDFTSGSANLANTMEINDWTVATGQLSDHTADRDDPFESPDAFTNPHSIVVGGQTAGANLKLTQSPADQGVDAVEDAPFHFSVAVKPDASYDGTVTLRLGSTTVSKNGPAHGSPDLSAGSWQVVEIPLDKGRWPKNWNEQDADAEIEFSGAGAGTIKFDAARLARMFRFPRGRGTYWQIEGGNTKWLFGDTKTYQDQIASDSKIQRVAAFSGEYYPSAPAAPSGSISADLAGAGAGNVDDGAHSYVVTFVDDHGNESGASASDSVTVADKSTDGQVDVTSIPTGTSGVIVDRKVYRTVAGDTGDHKLVGAIGDNTSTSFTDNVADSSLGAAVPDGATVADP